MRYGLPIEHIARVTHEANRVLQILEGDPSPSPTWDDAPNWQRDSAIDGVIARIEEVLSPAEMHENWLKYKESEGWVYGLVKDPEKKTHPCMLPYHRLPENQKIKDGLFSAIVDSLQ